MPAENQTITLTPTSTLIYVNTSALSTDGAKAVRESYPSNIVGSQFNVRYNKNTSTNVQIYYFAIGKL